MNALQHGWPAQWQPAKPPCPKLKAITNMSWVNKAASESKVVRRWWHDRITRPPHGREVAPSVQDRELRLRLGPHRSSLARLLSSTVQSSLKGPFSCLALPSTTSTFALPTT